MATDPTLVFIYGQVASGKLTVARALAAQTEMALFHNHLVVDAVAAVFPFGSPAFVRLRERFWLEVIETAILESRSLIFTFAPEPSVAPDFPARVEALVKAAGGTTVLVALTVSPTTQAGRLVAADRATFGKLRSLELLAELRDAFDASMAAMPTPALRIDTDTTTPEAAAVIIARHLGR